MSSEIILPDGQEGETPSSRIERVFEKMEMMSLQKGDNIDISLLNDAQRDKLLDVMQQNENHAFEYHSKKLDNEKEIKIAKINAGTITQKTNRNALLLLIGGCFIITLCILFYNDKYLNVWLSFITGLIGGYGIGKFQKNEPNNKE